eukprot:Colp12_sorted_trinity150504_noHs@30364
MNKLKEADPSTQQLLEECLVDAQPELVIKVQKARTSSHVVTTVTTVLLLGMIALTAWITLYPIKATYTFGVHGDFNDVCPFKIARKLGLEKQPDGSYFKATWSSDVEVDAKGFLPARFSGSRLIGSAIYHMFVGANSTVALHTLEADEVWHYYLGDAITILSFNLETKDVEETCLGADILGGCVPQYVAKHNHWIGAYLPEGSRWILTGAQLAPGFDPADSHPANRTQLIEAFPEYADIITRLTTV